MKTIEEIKNEVAVKHGYKNWHDADLCTSYDQSDALVTEAMQEYAKQCCDEQIKACAENSSSTNPKDYLLGNMKSNVLKTQNITINHGKR